MSKIERRHARADPAAPGSLVLVALLIGSLGFVPGVGGVGALAPVYGGTMGNTSFVQGRLLGPNGSGLSSVPVSVVTYPCGSDPDSPAGVASCPHVASGTTDSNGAFSLPLPGQSGTYYLYSNRTSAYGGAGRWFRATGPLTQLAPITAPVFSPYGSAAIELPGYANLSEYFTTENLNVQVPVLSWTADGAFYVTSSLELVFYNFATGVLTPIAPWLALYQNVMNYAGVENTEWATPDGSFVYEFGCLSACANDSAITFYGVNVTTGARYEWNFTGADDGTTRLNAQINLVGRAGASTDAVLILSDGTLLDWNLGNRTEWVLGRLPYFEANNAYWVPQLDAWFDVSADALTTDRIDEIAYTGTSVHLEASGTWGSGIPSNFVGGMDYNLTAHRLYFTAGTCRTDEVVTAYATIGSGGRLTGVTSLGVSGCGFARPLPQSPPGFPTGSSEHRIGMAVDGPWVAGAWNATFQNNSWLLDPVTRGWIASNVSQAWVGPNGSEEYQASFDEEGLFYNGTYLVNLASTQCARHAPCSLDANASRGTIEWNWRLGEPEFPFPVAAPLAESTAPGEPALIGGDTTNTSATVLWDQPDAGSAEILNYTAYYTEISPNLGPSGSLSLPSGARSVVVANLTPRTCYLIQIVPLNLHYHGAPLNDSLCTGPAPPPGPPYGLGATAVSPTALRVSWSNPTGPIVNETVYLGLTCTDLQSYSTGGETNHYLLSGLRPATEYCLGLRAWAPTGPSAASPDVETSTLPYAPTGLSVVPLSSEALWLTWANPSGLIVNDTVWVGGDCSSLTKYTTGGPAETWTVTGLSASHRYCLAIEAWAPGGPNGTLAWANMTTWPATPPDVHVSSPAPDQLRVTWSPDFGLGTNYAVSTGAACRAAILRWTGSGSTVLIDALQQNTPYCVLVTASNPFGTAPDPGSAVATTLPMAPTSLKAWTQPDGTIGLSWSDPAGSLSHETVRWGSPCSALQNQTLPWPSEAFDLPSFSARSRVCVAVGVEGDGGPSNWTWTNVSIPTTSSFLNPPSPDMALAGIGIAAAGAVALGVVAFVLARRQRRRGRSTSPPTPARARPASPARPARARKVR